MAINRRTILLLAAFILGTLAGYLWKQDIYVRDKNKTQVNIFKGYSVETKKLAYGFACLCQKDNSSVTSWNGDSDINCQATQNPDKPIALNDPYWIPADLRVSIPMPTNACCKQLPKTKNGNLPQVKEGTQCWKSG